MPEADESQKEKEFYTDVPATCEAFFLKGCNSTDWGMKNRLSRIFDPVSGRTVMLAIDHGYFQGPTTGLERVDVTILPLLPYATRCMLTRGILRASYRPLRQGRSCCGRAAARAFCATCPNEQIAIDIDDAIRLNVAAMAVQVFIGGKMETQSVHNMTRLVDMGNRYGIPTLGVTAVGTDMARDAKYMRLACRIIAELGVTLRQDLLHGGRVSTRSLPRARCR